MSELKKYRV